MRRPALTLADAMVLIVAVAVGLALARDPWLRMNVNAVNNIQMPYRLRYWVALAYPLLAPLAAAVPVLARLRGRRAVRGAWVLGCAAATAALAVRGLSYLPSYRAGRTWMWGPVTPWIASAEATGFAVAGAWIALALSGRWRGRAGWVDRLGLAVGSAWVAATIGGAILDALRQA